LLAIPGIPAALVAFQPGKVCVVTRLAAAFGLGYVAAGGCAFALSSSHLFRLSTFLPLWLVVSGALWVLAAWRTSLAEHGRAILAEIRQPPLALVVGSAVVLIVLAIHLPYLHYLGGPHYVYYLNGVEVANSHGVPAQTLEYGQSWPPATDKAVLDAFTGVLVLFSQNPLIGPGVLLVLSVLGAGLGLWASAWELGLRYTAGLLPLLLLANGILFDTRFSGSFTEYRAEDFGRAVAFCALALSVVAIRERNWRTAVVAGVVLAAASGSHLIPVVVVVLALACVGLARLLYDARWRSWIATLRSCLVIGVTGGVLWGIVRAFAGGSFGLQGASNQFAYNATSVRFDPTAYLYLGTFVPRDRSSGFGHPYAPPASIVHDLLVAGLGQDLPRWLTLLVLVAALAASVALFFLVKTDVRIVGLVGLGVFAGIIVISLLFDYRYHIYIDATFGQRRLGRYASIGLILVGLAVLEMLVLRVGRSSLPSLVVAAIAPIVILTAWVAPSTALSHYSSELSSDRVAFVNWVRAHTACGARFLVNQRSEGTMASLTGRNDLTEGMGPFLRPEKLPYVVALMLDARNFYQHPQRNEAILRKYDITYVVVARSGDFLGYVGPETGTNLAAIKSAPFLQQVYANRSAIIYRVAGAVAPPASPLLKGRYLHCLTEPAHF
ncbi:MAG: hypothetical protein LBV34_11000, partial [Nocardiopsaceae bacterium]|jgi:hypothetical protein|nr:hypothetical protein [Nocardiopsaceae bacterium]